MKDTIRTIVKRLLRIEDTERDAQIDSICDREWKTLAREFDLYVQPRAVEAHAAQCLYDTGVNYVRLLHVLHANRSLAKVTSWSQDVLTPLWQCAIAEGAPAVWWNDLLPPELSSLPETTERRFIVFPAPAMDGAGVEGFLVYQTEAPADLQAPMRWLEPYLLYIVAAAAVREIAEEKGDGADETELHAAMQLAEFLESLAQMWKTLFRERLPI